MKKMNEVCKKGVLVITLLLYCLAVYSTDRNSQTERKKLSSIVFVKPLYEINRIPFSFYFSEPMKIKEQEVWEEVLPYYDESKNPYDSIAFTYNQQNKLTFIRYHRKNTIQTDSLIYDKKGRLIKYFSYSDKENPNFETKQTTYKYKKNSILQYENGTWKNTYKINLSNQVLEFKTDEFCHTYEYNPNKTIKKITTKDLRDNSSFETIINYDDNRQSTFVFGNTPQWFCLTNRFLFMFDSYVKEIYITEDDYVFSVKYFNNVESILVEELYRLENLIQTNEYKLKYTY